ncbi:helix-turn-helix domain-containing protein [Paenibacillus pinihumi]|uniref:helix-turn-helix domain-containing protein n=1 Tax=Paenibacillus pinihumi TaxID=669462 RepID=UPI00048D590B|nr:helix-turn-helix transcriptional regulator [Paenibacillus pinihumi]
MQIRSNLRQLAESRGVSVREIARAIDYRFESVRKMYNNEMERYPRDLLEKLCGYFNVTPAELLVSVDDT